METSLNFDRWALVCPEGAARIAALGKSDRNLAFPLSLTNSPQEEAAEWFKSLYLKNTQVIFVYGIGTGDYYEAAKAWLREERQRCLVFLEDDPEVMRRFIESGQAREILFDDQVFIYLLEEGAGSIAQLGRITEIFALRPMVFTGLRSYSVHRDAAYRECRSKVNFLLSLQEGWMSEAMTMGKAFMRNCLLNLLTIDGGYWGDSMEKAFAGVPAIICGAGPSLDKNIDILAGLADRALIFAGGTAMNALNARNILPHFGVGIDPNPAQYTRLVMNHAYETPFFYRVRMLHEALQMVHGDRLFISGSSGYGVMPWLEKKLGIEAREWKEGFNVLNFSLVLAHALGCNPIICVGVDLAYSGGKSYGSGLLPHPLHDSKVHFKTKQFEEAVLTKNDIHGKPVDTLWKWIAESVWYTQYAEEHPELKIINATEGGIGFEGIENIPLAEVQSRYLTKSYDLEMWVQGEIQNCPLPKRCHSSDIASALLVLQQSLETCAALSERLMEAHAAKSSVISVAEMEEALRKEEAYQWLLSEFSRAYTKRMGVGYKQYELSEGVAPEVEREAKRAELESGRYAFLAQAAHANRDLIRSTIGYKEALDRVIAAQQPVKEVLQEAVPSYSCNGKMLTLKDAGSGLDYSEQLMVPLEESVVCYPSGSIKHRCWYSQGLLHGPSTFYRPDGSLLAQACYLDGKREGTWISYYQGGALHSRQRYRHGLREGIQRYLYPDGTVKSVLPYAGGKLHGLVELYYPNGRLFRRLRFVEGKRDGVEQIWYPNGDLEVEASYAADRPVGLTRAWHPGGILAREIFYDDDAQRIASRRWDANGKEMADEGEEGVPDYFEQVQSQTLGLTDSIGQMVGDILRMAPLIAAGVPERPPQEGKEAGKDGLSDQLQLLQVELEHLKALEATLKEQTAHQGAVGNEELWKTLHSKEFLEKNLDAYAKKMGDDMKAIEEGLKKIQSKYPPKTDRPEL